MSKFLKSVSILAITCFFGINPIFACDTQENSYTKVDSELSNSNEKKEAWHYSKCVMCDLLNTGLDITERKQLVLYENKSFVAYADFGSMVEGYVLIPSKRHINSMSELTDQEYEDFMDIQKNVEEGLEKIYGKNCVCFEHGSGKNNQENAASSVKHAHFHMVAIDKFREDIHDKIIKDMEMVPIQNQRDLQNRADEPYMHYISGDGTQYVSTKKDKMESQYMRKMISEQFGTEYNWKNPETRKKFQENVLATEEKWERYLLMKNESVFQGEDDEI